jgi:hypothetical protein
MLRPSARSATLLLFVVMSTASAFTPLSIGTARSTSHSIETVVMRPRPRAAAVTLMARPNKPRSTKPAAKKQGIDATIPQLIYYGAYTAFFGKLLLVLIERATGGG